MADIKYGIWYVKGYPFLLTHPASFYGVVLDQWERNFFMDFPDDLPVWTYTFFIFQANYRRYYTQTVIINDQVFRIKANKEQKVMKQCKEELRDCALHVESQFRVLHLIVLI